MRFYYFLQGDVSKALEKFDSILIDHPSSPRAVWGKARVLDKMSEQQRSNKLLEEAISLMDQALRLSKTPEALLLEIADRLADRQAFRGMLLYVFISVLYVKDLTLVDTFLCNTQYLSLFFAFFFKKVALVYLMKKKTTPKFLLLF